MSSPEIILLAIKAIKTLFQDKDGTILWSCYRIDATLKFYINDGTILCSCYDNDGTILWSL